MKKSINGKDVENALMGHKLDNFIGKEFNKQVNIEYQTQAVLERVNPKIAEFLDIKLKQFEDALNQALAQANAKMKAQYEVIEERIAWLEKNNECK